jgi:hypothetical protein
MKGDVVAALIVAVVCVLLILSLLGPAVNELVGTLGTWIVLAAAAAGACGSIYYLTYGADPSDEWKRLAAVIGKAPGAASHEEIVSGIQRALAKTPPPATAN